jgi:hypothetical protein
MNADDVYLGNFHRRTISVIRLRYRFMRLAEELLKEGDTKRAEEVLDRVVELTPHDKLPYDMFMPGIAEVYYKLGEMEKGNTILEKMMHISERHLAYYTEFRPKQRQRIQDEITYHIRVIGNVMQIAAQYKATTLASEAEELFNRYRSSYMGF